VGALLSLWGFYVWNTKAERFVILLDALVDLSNFAELYAEHVETLIDFGADPARTSDQSSGASSLEQHLLTRFRDRLKYKSHLRLTLRRLDETASPDAGGPLSV
jgi:hypothetical protein